MPFPIRLLIGALCVAAPLAAAETPMEEGYRAMYNMDFAAAHRIFEEWGQANPQDAVAPASDAAAYLFTEFDRLHILQSEFFTHDQHFVTDHKLAPDPVTKQKFDGAIEKSRRIAALSPSDPDSRFAVILTYGLRSDYEGLIEKRYSAGFDEMKTGTQLAEKLLAKHPEYADAWVAVGVENYMLSTRPAPMRWLFRLAGAQTDRGVGIAKLKVAAEHGHYLAPFAKLLLAVAALRERDLPRARFLLGGLVHEYPRNPLYRQELARVDSGGDGE